MLIVFVICNNSNQDCAVSRTWVLVTVFTWACSYHIKHALFVMLLLRIVHCLSVCPSCLYILSKRPNISSHFFHPPSGSTTVLVFAHKILLRNSDGTLFKWPWATV